MLVIPNAVRDPASYFKRPLPEKATHWGGL